MREMLTTLQRFLAARHSLHEASLFLEVARHDVLYELVGISALLGSGAH